MIVLATGPLREAASGLYLEGLAVDHTYGVTWYSDVLAATFMASPARRS